MEQLNNYEKGLVDIRQPLFIRIVQVLGVILYVLDLLVIGFEVIQSIVEGRFFQHPIADAFGGSPLYWVIVHSCFAIAAALVGFFSTLCVVSLLVWIYRTATKQIPYPRAYADAVIEKFSAVFWVLVSYGCVFFGSVFWGIVSFGYQVVTELTGSGSSFGVGMLILAGPFILIACIAILMVVFWFCILLLPGAGLSRRMLRYVLRPTVRADEYEQVFGRGE